VLRFVRLFTQILLKIPLFSLVLFLAIFAGLISCTRHEHAPVSNRNTQAPADETVQSQPHVNINIATKEDLQTLPGIGPTMSERIIEHRRKYGSFKRTEHLMMIRGFSDKLFRKIAPLVTVE
jgi:competence ComEA-like helix-hairpin-helix protein